MSGPVAGLGLGTGLAYSPAPRIPSGEGPTGGRSRWEGAGKPGGGCICDVLRLAGFGDQETARWEGRGRRGRERGEPLPRYPGRISSTALLQ